MKTLRKFGGFAALYMAIAYLTGIVIFLVVLNYPAITDPSEKAALNVEKQSLVFTTNLLMYVFFGIFLIILTLALYERLKSGSQALMQVTAAIGVVWAGSLIAGGMVANAGLAVIVPLFAQDPSQAALTWQGVETVASGLSNGNGEILGGLWTLLVSLCALRTGGLPRALNILGLLVGAVGILSLVPAWIALTGVFGLTQVIWFAWLGVVLLSKRSNQAA